MSDADPVPRPRWARSFVLARCVLAGLTIAAAIPPWGWWPLAFLGIAQWDRLLAEQPWNRRLARTWLVAASWLFPTMLWMWDLTEPGYVVAASVFSLFFGLTALAVPGRAPWRWLALPAAIVLAELWRSTWPFGGVPLATLSMSQAASVFASPARLANAIAVSGIVAIGGVACSAAWERRWRPTVVAGSVVLAATVLGWVAPQGAPSGQPLRVAVVQGGGEQRTRAATSDAREVFERHLEASELIEGPVDLVVWPENVVSLTGLLEGSPEDTELTALARRLGATLEVGITEGAGPESFLNASVVYEADGSRVARFDKVRRVPFGEYVPFRSFIESIAGDAGLPRRDAVPGTEPAVLHTEAGPLGVVISWEVFFTDRAADAIGNGGEVLLNPTNGASYWLTQVQTQQVASSRLRALETGRYVLQAAPTGFSAIVDPDGRVIDCVQHRPAREGRDNGDAVTTMGWCRSDVSEQVVLQAEIDRRGGSTVALGVGPWPALVASLGAIAAAWVAERRGARSQGFSSPGGQGDGRRSARRWQPDRT